VIFVRPEAAGAATPDAAGLAEALPEVAGLAEAAALAAAALAAALAGAVEAGAGGLDEPQAASSSPHETKIPGAKRP